MEMLLSISKAVKFKIVVNLAAEFTRELFCDVMNFLLFCKRHH